MEEDRLSAARERNDHADRKESFGGPPGTQASFQYLYVMDGFRGLATPWDSVREVLGYAPGARPQRFMVLGPDKSSQLDQLFEVTTPEEILIESAVAVAVGKQTAGPGLQKDARRKKAVEDRAMVVATEHYRSLGWIVEDVSLTSPFDLSCSKAGASLHVEVKGTQTKGEFVILTKNEVIHANSNHPNVALAIVAGITVSSQNGDPVGQGGTLDVRDSWRPDPSDLVPLTYKYRVPPK